MIVAKPVQCYSAALLGDRAYCLFINFIGEQCEKTHIRLYLINQPQKASVHCTPPHLTHYFVVVETGHRVAVHPSECLIKIYVLETVSSLRLSIVVPESDIEQLYHSSLALSCLCLLHLAGHGKEKHAYTVISAIIYLLRPWML